MTIATDLGSTFALTDPLAKIQWSTIMHKQTRDALFFKEMGLMSAAADDPDPFTRMGASPIVEVEEFGKHAGDRVRHQLERNLVRDPRSGANNTRTYGIDNTMVGYEEQLAYWDIEVALQVLKHAVGTNDPKVTELRSNLQWESRAQVLLGEWIKNQQEELVLDTLYDGVPYITSADSIASVVTHPRIVFAGNATAQGNIGDDDIMGYDEITRIESYVRKNNINQASVSGKDCFPLLVSEQIYRLLMSDSDVINVYGRGDTRGSDNALLAHEGLMLGKVKAIQYNRLRDVASGTNADNTVRCIVLGAKAALIGYGSMPMIVTRDELNYRDRYGIGVRQHLGGKRTDWQDAGNNNTLHQSSVLWNTWEEDEY